MTPPLVPQRWRVERLQRELAGIFTLELVPAEPTAPFRFAPGQFNMLYHFAAGEVPISMSGDAGEADRLRHTIRVVGRTTQAMAGLAKGAILGVRGPYGTSWPLDAADGHDVVVVAGGIGLAPLRPAILALLAAREHYGRIVILYGARTPDEILFRRDLQRWRSRFDIEVLVTVDRAARSWTGNVGVVTSLIGRAGFDPVHAVAFLCGPEVMIRHTAIALEGRGIGPERIYASLERNMKCAIGQCGHCQLGPIFVCKDGPVLRYDLAGPLLERRQL